MYKPVEQQSPSCTSPNVTGSHSEAWTRHRLPVRPPCLHYPLLSPAEDRSTGTILRTASTMRDNQRYAGREGLVAMIHTEEEVDIVLDAESTRHAHGNVCHSRLHTAVLVHTFPFPFPKAITSAGASCQLRRDLGYGFCHVCCTHMQLFPSRK